MMAACFVSLNVCFDVCFQSTQHARLKIIWKTLLPPASPTLIKQFLYVSMVPFVLFSVWIGFTLYTKYRVSQRFSYTEDINTFYVFLCKISSKMFYYLNFQTVFKNAFDWRRNVLKSFSWLETTHTHLGMFTSVWQVCVYCKYTA